MTGKNAVCCKKMRPRTDNLCRLLCMLTVLLFMLPLAACEKAPTEDKLYEAADALLASGQFEAAREAFLALGDYQDAAAKVSEGWLEEGKAYMESGAFDAAREALQHVTELPDAAELLLKTWYLEGAKLFESGDISAAKEAFCSAVPFEDAHERIKACDYLLAKALLESGALDEAEAAFLSLSGYEDADECVTRIRYQKAEALLAAGEYKQAAEAFLALGDALDAAAVYERIVSSVAYRAETIQAAAVGDRIEWGTFEQDNDLANGPEPIQWRVLSVTDGRLLLISEYVLDCRMFNAPFQKTRWDVSDLRKWLNGEFYETSFTDEERQGIALSVLQNEDNTEYDVSGCADTEDYIFVLSLTDAMTLFADNDDRIGINTPYAIARGAFTDTNGAGWWWLRTPGYTTIFNTVVLTDGEASAWGTFYGYDHRAVRPSLVLDPGALMSLVP